LLINYIDLKLFIQSFFNYSSLMKEYKNLRIFITGINGFKGSWLALYLHNLGAKVIGVGLKNETSEIFNKLKVYNKVKFIDCDILHFQKLKEIISQAKPDIFFHLAAQSIVSESYINPIKTLNTNIIGSANILELVKKLNIQSLVYITSDKCYLNKETYNPYSETDILGGIDFYSSSKACAELVFNSYYNNFYRMKKFIKIASARAGNVIGGGDLKAFRIVPDIYRIIKKNSSNKKILFLRNPKATRPWQHVMEPVSGYMLLGLKILNNELSTNLLPSWNFGPDKINCKTVENVSKDFIKNFGKDLKIKIKNKSNKNFYESKLLFLSNKKSRKELKWKPILNYNDTIKFTADWYYKNLNEDLSEVTKETYYQIEYFNSFYNF